MRPTISPAMKTATIAKTIRPYSPDPTPPKITSPSCISAIGTSPPNGVNESCIEFTDPFDAAVVAVAQSAEDAMPNRASLPSMLPPMFVAVATGSAPSLDNNGLPPCSARHAAISKTTNTAVIAASSAHPSRVSPIILPNV